MGEPVTCAYKNVGGHEILLDVYGAGEGRRGVVVYLHGGALIWGTRKMLRQHLLERYLADGLAVAAPDYRFAPETKLPEILEDVKDAFKWVRGEGAKRFGFDGTRVGVVGHSAGGYLALACGFAVKPAVSGIVAYYGYGDLAGEWYAKPDPFYTRTEAEVPEAEALSYVGKEPVSNTRDEKRMKYYLYLRQKGLWPKEVTGLDPVAEREALLKYCPAARVTRNWPATLLLHGENDTDVPYAQSVQMADALAKAGVEHELVTIAKGEHVFDDDTANPAVIAAFDKVDAFLERKLGEA